MEEQTVKNNSNYTPLIIMAVLVLVAFLGIGLIKPKSQENKAVADIKQTESTSPSPTTDQQVASTTQTSASSAAVTKNGITMNELASHSTSDSCWVLISGKVYDVTKAISVHPGGAKAITNWCGKDATIAFNTRGGKGPHGQKAIDLLEKMLLGLLEVKK